MSFSDTQLELDPPTQHEPDVERIREPDDAAPGAFAGGDFAARYERAGLLGVGGMGEVRAWRDRATGREVAVKSIRDNRRDAEAARRFAREARIQAQLEHPSIVPVYDLGVDDGGDVYFTMKRVRGHSLSRVLATLADRGDGGAGYSQRKLLSVMARVAMTLEYAHRRGVINRDLKPANIMLGAFDEVYVIDWGLATLVAADPPPPTSRPELVLGLPFSQAALQVPLVDSSQQPETGAGRLLGTPGYVAPEQIQDPAAVDARADVYALGAILFEILSGQPLHRGDVLADVVISTLTIDGASPAERAPERAIAPELDGLCRAATRLDPRDRLPRAADLSRAIERYLDGDRDLSRRRELAGEAAANAAALLDEPGGDEVARRGQALREVGRALALDPDHAGARAALVRAFTAQPGEVPAAARPLFRAAAVDAFRLSARVAMLGLASYALYLPLLLWMGVRQPGNLALMAAAIAGALGLTYTYYRRPPADLRLPWPHLAATTLALLTGVPLFGPLVLLPTIVLSTGVGYITTFGRGSWRYIALWCLVIVAPLALQLAGILPASYRLAGGTFEVVPRMADFPPVATAVFLIVTHVVVMAATLGFVGRLRRHQLDGERRLQVQAWLLSELAPGVKAG